MTNKLLSIIAFPFNNKESFNKSLPFNNKLESILAPLATVKESLKLKPPSIDNLPLIVKFESINTLPITLKESFNVSTESILTLPLTYKLESTLAFNVFTLVLILLDNEIVSLSILFDNMTDVSEIFNFKLEPNVVLLAKLLILFDKVIVSFFCNKKEVSLLILFVNIAEVSDIFNLKPEEESIAPLI